MLGSMVIVKVPCLSKLKRAVAPINTIDIGLHAVFLASIIVDYDYYFRMACWNVVEIGEFGVRRAELLWALCYSLLRLECNMAVFYPIYSELGPYEQQNEYLDGHVLRIEHRSYVWLLQVVAHIDKGKPRIRPAITTISKP